MHGRTRVRGLKFASMAVIVVLALTGFSTGRGSSGGSSSSSSGGSDGGGGGGCSSSSQDHDTSSSSSGGSTSGLGKSDDYDDYDDSYDDGYSDSGDSTDSAAAPEDGTAELVSCVTDKEPYATVVVTNPNAYEASFVVDVIFEREGATVTEGSEQVTVPADGTAEVEVYPEDPGAIDLIELCSVEERALWTSN